MFVRWSGDMLSKISADTVVSIAAACPCVGGRGVRGEGRGPRGEGRAAPSDAQQLCVRPCAGSLQGVLRVLGRGSFRAPRAWRDRTKRDDSTAV